MKNTEQIIMENIDLHYREYSRGEVEDIKMLMRKYAEEAIDEASGIAEADIQWYGETPMTTITDEEETQLDPVTNRSFIAGNERPVEEGLDFEIPVIRQSILQIKDELK